MALVGLKGFESGQFVYMAVLMMRHFEMHTLQGAMRPVPAITRYLPPTGIPAFHHFGNIGSITIT